MYPQPRSSALAPVLPIMRKYDANGSPEVFHEAVNLAFHRAESTVYDEVHRDMWESVPQEIGLLVSDWRAVGRTLRHELSLLDVGCGTGLATESVLKSPIGPSVSSVTLLDTSPEMLQSATRRARAWGVRTEVVTGKLGVVALPKRTYDVVVICSVLHHIPDLAAFCRELRSVQHSGALFIHAQDPNGDFLSDPALLARSQKLVKFREAFLGKWRRRLHPARLARRILAEPFDYIGAVNAELTARGVIRAPMTAEDIWRVTDIHVYDGGVSLRQLKDFLPDYALVSARSYSYFGELPSRLPASFRAREAELSRNRSMKGREIGAIWEMS